MLGGLSVNGDQPLVPGVRDLMEEAPYGRTVAGDAVVAIVATQLHPQRAALVGYGVMPVSRHHCRIRVSARVILVFAVSRRTYQRFLSDTSQWCVKPRKSKVSGRSLLVLSSRPFP